MCTLLLQTYLILSSSAFYLRLYVSQHGFVHNKLFTLMQLATLHAQSMHRFIRSHSLYFVVYKHIIIFLQQKHQQQLQ